MLEARVLQSPPEDLRGVLVLEPNVEVADLVFGKQQFHVVLVVDGLSGSARGPRSRQYTRGLALSNGGRAHRSRYAWRTRSCLFSINPLDKERE